jgi:predicted ArsR family transcriptional regulator
MKNECRSDSRNEVLQMVRTSHGITAGQIQEAVDLSNRQVLKILSDLTDEGVINWKMLRPKGGISRSPRRSYFITARHDTTIPAAWDVLAYFFGRIAAEPAIV